MENTHQYLGITLEPAARRVPRSLEDFPYKSSPAPSFLLKISGSRIPPKEYTNPDGNFCAQMTFLNIHDTYGLIDSLAENSKQEDCCDGWSQITGDGLDVVEELSALC